MVFFSCLVKWESTDPVSAGEKCCLYSAVRSEVLLERGEMRLVLLFLRKTERNVPRKPPRVCNLPLCIGKQQMEFYAPRLLCS